MFAAVSTLLLGAIAPVVFAQPEKFQIYPQRPVRIVVPSTPGGGLDIIARIMAPRLTEKWGVQVVIDNRAGAGGVIGTDIVSKAAPDGHTLLIVTTGFVTNPFLIKQLPYKTPQDFEPVMVVGYTPVVLVAHPTFQSRTIKELIAQAKEKPNTIPFGSSGTGSGGHLAMVLMQRVADFKLVHVPYKGAGADRSGGRGRGAAGVYRAGFSAGAGQGGPLACVGDDQYQARERATRCAQRDGSGACRLRDGRLVRIFRASTHTEDAH